MIIHVEIDLGSEDGGGGGGGRGGEARQEALIVNTHQQNNLLHKSIILVILEHSCSQFRDRCVCIINISLGEIYLGGERRGGKCGGGRGGEARQKERAHRRCESRFIVPVEEISLLAKKGKRQGGRAVRCRANTACIRLSRQDSGLGFQAEVPAAF